MFCSTSCPTICWRTVPLNRYKAVIVPAAEYLGEPGRAALARYVEHGGKLLLTPVSNADRERPGVCRRGRPTARRRRGTGEGQGGDGGRRPHRARRLPEDAARGGRLT